MSLRDFTRMAKFAEEAVTEMTNLKPTPTKIGGVQLSAEQRKAFAKNESIRIAGLTDKAGKKYVSDVRWNRQTGRPELRNVKPMEVSLKRSGAQQQKIARRRI
jgi:hypothetical protein